MKRAIIKIFLLSIFAASVGMSYTKVFKYPAFTSRICLECFEDTLCLMPENFRDILSQRFKFLDKGGQFYAFISEDGKYILKLFRTAKIRDLVWIKNLPIPFLLQPALNQLHHKQSLVEQKLLQSCRIASTIMKEQTALIGIHLSKTHDLKTKILLEDKDGIHRVFSADNIPFVIQKKAELFTESIQEIAREKGFDEVKKTFLVLLDEILYRAKRLVVNNDPFFQKNYGFYDKKPIEIDVGSFSLDATLARPACLAKEFYFCSKQLANFVRQEVPELKEWLKEAIEERWQRSLESEYHETIPLNSRM